MARTAVADVMTRRVVYLPGDTMLDEAALLPTSAAPASAPARRSEVGSQE